MRWSFEIFTSKPATSANSVVEEIVTKLDILEEESPSVLEAHQRPEIEAAVSIKPKDYQKDLKKREALPPEDGFYIPTDIGLRMKTSKSCVVVDGFDVESSPLGVSVLKFLIEKLQPCLIRDLDTWETSESFLERLGALKFIPLESEETDALASDLVEEEKTEDILEVLQAQFFRLLERGSRDMNARIEAEKALGKASPGAQKLLHFLMTSKNIEEQNAIKHLKSDDAKLKILASELENLLANLKKSL
jgi:hypothetical protein